MDKETRDLLLKIQESIDITLEDLEEIYYEGGSPEDLDDFHSQGWYMELAQHLAPIETILGNNK